MLDPARPRSEGHSIPGSVPVTAVSGPWCEAPPGFFLAKEWWFLVLAEHIYTLHLHIGHEERLL